MSPAKETDMDNWKGLRVHFVGIGGAGMSSLARILHAAGAAVSGSDLQDSPSVQNLRALGIAVAAQHDPLNIPSPCHLAVITAAVQPSNPELNAARLRGVPVLKYAQLLGRISRQKHCIAISGCHGKTTTTGLAGYILQQCGLDPAIVVGGCVEQIGGSGRPGAGPHFVVEACEYDRSFWNLTPASAIINNVEADHMDYFRDIEDVVDAFAGLASRVHPQGRLLVNGDNPLALRAAAAAACPVHTFGAGELCHWRFLNARRRSGLTTFDIHHNGRFFCQAALGLPGLHNVRNALAAFALSQQIGAPAEAALQALASYRGACRRLQQIALSSGVRVMDDYAHHPTEIRATLAAARQDYGAARLWCVFQPHQCSRTRLLFSDFVTAFHDADHVIIPDIYSVRDSEADRQSIHARDLVNGILGHGGAAEYIPAFEGVTDRLAESVREGDVVLTMGAGPVDRVARDLARRLETRPHVAAA